MRSFKQNFFYKNLNIIRKLKDYADKEKVTLLLDEYNKKQEEDYFLTQKNIKIGRINTDIKNSNPLTYCQSPQKKNNFMNQRKQYLLNDNSFNSSSNAYSNFKRSYSISSRKVSRLTSNIETASVSKKNIIDNSDLKRHFHNIRQRINDYKTKKNHRKKLDIEVPLRIKQSLYKQEKFFKKIKREKTRNKKMKKISK